MDRKFILVIGGAGYIGSHACKLLKQEGYIPVVYDNLVMGHKDFVQWGPFEYGDIRDQFKLIQVMKKYKPMAVFHFAAFGYVGESVLNPAKYYENNVYGTICLLNAMKESGVSKIVFSSSCATYGIPRKVPISEKEIQNPINPYGRSKLFVEKILQDYDKAFGIKNIILRFFNAAGADSDCQVGEDHSPEQHLIPLALDVALGKKLHINIFGDDYLTSDGTCIRDYVHVDDIAKAHLLALLYLDKNEKSDFFNLGLGCGFSVKEVVVSVQKITGKKIKTNVLKRREGDPAILIADPTKANKVLNWNPSHNNIDVLIEHAWNWHLKRFSIQKIEKESNHESFSNCSNV